MRALLGERGEVLLSAYTAKMGRRDMHDQERVRDKASDYLRVLKYLYSDGPQGRSSSVSAWLDQPPFFWLQDQPAALEILEMKGDARVDIVFSREYVSKALQFPAIAATRNPMIYASEVINPMWSNTLSTPFAYFVEPTLCSPHGEADDNAYHHRVALTMAEWYLSVTDYEQALATIPGWVEWRSLIQACVSQLNGCEGWVFPTFNHSFDRKGSLPVIACPVMTEEQLNRSRKSADFLDQVHELTEQWSTHASKVSKIVRVDSGKSIHPLIADTMKQGYNVSPMSLLQSRTF